MLRVFDFGGLSPVAPEFNTFSPAVLSVINGCLLRGLPRRPLGSCISSGLTAAADGPSTAAAAIRWANSICLLVISPPMCDAMVDDILFSSASCLSREAERTLANPSERASGLRSNSFGSGVSSKNWVACVWLSELALGGLACDPHRQSMAGSGSQHRRLMA